MVFLWTDGIYPVNRVGGQRATVRNAAAVMTPHGQGIACSTGQQNLEWAQQFMRTSDGAGAGDFTMLVLANPTAGGGAVQHLVAHKNDAAGSPFAQAAILANGSDTGAYSSGSLALLTYYYPGSTGVMLAGGIDGGYHVFVAVRRSGVLELHVDGVFRAAAAGTVRNILQTASRYTAVGSRGNGTTEASSARITFAAEWDRALELDEIVALGSPRALWQLLQPRLIWVPPEVVGGGADFVFSASGGIQFGGTAATEATAQFAASSSGGITFSGSATGSYTGDFSAAGSGGLSFGGAAAGTFTSAYAFTAAGGLQFGGAAGASSGSDYAMTGSGGLTLGGSASAVNTAVYAMTGAGGIVFAGAAAAQADTGYEASGSGGITFAGSAASTTTPAFAFTSSGGLAFGGDATETYTTSYNFAASGGLSMGGAATASMTSAGSGTGATVDDIWNGILLEASLSPADMLRIILAAVSGRTTGIGTDNERYLSVDGSKARVAATFDASGNRQAVTLDGSA